MRTISFVIPVYNEEERLSKTFDALKKLKLDSSLLLESIIFVDDGSKDSSLSLIKKNIPNLKRTLNTDIKLLSYPENKGKGYAVKTGLLASTSDYSLFFDVDISTPLTEISKFITYMEKGADLIIGTRKSDKSKVLVHQSPLREFMGHIFTQFAKMFVGIKVTDFTCGFKAVSYKASKIIAPLLRVNGWGYDVELIFLTERVGFTTQEVPVIWSNDPNSRVKMYKAVITTLKDLLTIKWEYSLKQGLISYSKTMGWGVSRFASIFL
ncbi:MAG TPA: glycosyltransferase [Patescibacteria group bacterium]|nr:glycosyltransferase [Patescibacteria group bacterium]